VANQTHEGGGWLVEALHPIDEEGYCRVRDEDFAAHLDYLASLGGQLWVAPVGQVAARLLHWRTVQLRSTPLADGRVQLHLAEPASEDWQVTLSGTGSWKVVAGNGQLLPLSATGDSLSFEWPVGQASATLEPAGTTAISASSWGQIKEFFLARTP
jgi:hypothetical protein